MLSIKIEISDFKFSRFMVVLKSFVFEYGFVCSGRNAPVKIYLVLNSYTINCSHKLISSVWGFKR